ncbi:hypothetical protein [uncultured Croceitalea sp.]|uniref:hypothetical protein n=1 Tax=uncultured Croceitalea sp. TaxID=1798908 RepID=UPI00330609D9
MRSKQNTNTNNKSTISKGYKDINGLKLFKKQLEKHFFGEAIIRPDTDKKDSKYNLTINLNCNFSLTEGLILLNSGDWGGFCENSAKLEHSGFELSVLNLQKENNNKVVFEEIAIHFKDTSLFITKIPNQNITDHLCTILNAISENFVHFTKGLTEMPYEIFIPVFEATTENDSSTSCAKPKMKTSYFDYWGMYFQSEIDQDSLVYDLKSKTIIDGDFFILTKE